MLKTAIRLELATIPPYLCAYWSIVDTPGAPPGYIKQKLQRILSEEMAHLGLACNLLSAFQDPGGILPRVFPALNHPGVVPVYPGPLPGGVHPGLRIHLSKLTKDQIGTQFMQVEFPSPSAVQVYGGKSFPTIGAFYGEIRAFVNQSALVVATDYQVESARNYVFRIKSKCDALKAIDTIAAEGEGAHGSPFVTNGAGTKELAHYYQFAEFFWQRKIVPCGDQGWGFCGDRIDWPTAIRDMAPVPYGGYHTDNAYQFDCEYTRILNSLTAAWQTQDPNQADSILQDTVSLMTSAAAGSLQYLAVQLMETPRHAGRGNYGPCFRLAD